MQTKFELENIAPLKDIVDVLLDDNVKLKNMDALEISALLKRAEMFVAGLREKLIPEANKVFKDRYVPEQGKLPLLNGLAMATTYTPKSTWSYPPSIVTMEASLKAKQKLAQTNGDATKLAGTIDPKVNTTFSITMAPPVSA